MKKINVQEYGIIEGKKEKETTLYLRKILEEFGNKFNVEIFFPRGDYHFYPEYAYEELMYISNHDDDTIKRVVFNLKEMENIVIKGENSNFIFHTEEMPFYLYKCNNIKIEGITIDYERSTFSEGIAEYVDSHTVRMFIEIARIF